MTRRKRTARVKRAGAWLMAVGALCILPVTTFAESRSTTASVDFTSARRAEPVLPVDPDWPGRENSLWPNQAEHETHVFSNSKRIPIGESAPDRQIPGATGAVGCLSINYVTPLNFGTEIDDGVFTVQQERPYLQTSDLRGTATGWKVTAIAGPFQDPETKSPAHALLSFRHGSPNSAHINRSPPDIPEMIELPANGWTQRLVEFAHENEGVGIWVARWYPEHGAARDFQLRLFSPALDGRLGFVLWVMNDAP